MKPLLVIVGETASGKSALAMDIARRFDGEIICGDAWTVYPGFNIGAAKPTAEERAEVPHHMLDVADPTVGYSAALFKVAAEKSIRAIQQQGKLPVLVGGSGLYIDSVLFDYAFPDQADTTERSRLEHMTLDELHTYAAELGLNVADVDARNKRRVIRHIENRGKKPVRSALREHTFVLGLRTPRGELEHRIEQRVDDMLARGLEAEATALAERYGWDCEPMKGIGYREWKPYVEGSESLAETRQQIVRDTLQLAKKQRTWFKRNNSIHWVDDPREAVEFVTTVLNK